MYHPRCSPFSLLFRWDFPPANCVFEHRAAMMEAGCSLAEGGDRDTRMWALPPVVPFGLLMQRLEAWLRRLLRDAQTAGREEVLL